MVVGDKPPLQRPDETILLERNEETKHEFDDLDEQWSDADEPHDDNQEHFLHKTIDMNQTQQYINEYVESIDLDPFNDELRNAFLDQIDFAEYLDKCDSCEFVNRVPKLHTNYRLEIGERKITIAKIIGKGSFGVIYL